jgi:hypothetical protein
MNCPCSCRSLTARGHDADDHAGCNALDASEQLPGPVVIPGAYGEQVTMARRFW